MNLSPIIISVLFPFCLGLGWYDGYGYHIFSKHLKKHRPRNHYSTGFTLWKKQHFWRKRRIMGVENVQKPKDILMRHRFPTRKRFLQYSPYFPQFFGRTKSEHKEITTKKLRTKSSDFNYNVYSKDNHRNAFVRRNFHRPPYYSFYFKSPSMYLLHNDDVGGHMHSGTSENQDNYVNKDIASSRKPLSSDSFGIISNLGVDHVDLDKAQFIDEQLGLNGEDNGQESLQGNGDKSITDGSFQEWNTFQNLDSEDSEILSEKPFIGGMGKQGGILESYPLRTNKFSNLDSDFNNLDAINTDENSKNIQTNLLFGPSLQNKDIDFGDLKPDIKSSGETTNFQSAVVPDQTLFNPKNIHFHNKPLEFPNQGSRALHLQGSYGGGFGGNINNENTGFKNGGGGLFINIAEEGSFNNDKSGCEGIQTRSCHNDSECSCYGSFFCIQGKCSMMIAKNNDDEASDSDQWWNR